MAEAELLGAGLDIEGWSFIKNEVQGKINEMTDRQGFILANQFFKKKRRNAICCQCLHNEFLNFYTL